MNTQRVEGHTPKDCLFCESGDNESRFIEQKFYAPDDEHQERARYRYVYFRFCNGCGCQGPQGNSPEQALELWNRRSSIDRLEKANEALVEYAEKRLEALMAIEVPSMAELDEHIEIRAALALAKEPA